MAGTAILSIKILSDASQAAKGLDQASTKVGRMQSGLSKMTGPALVAGAAVLAFGKASFDAASKVEQSMGAVDAVFGKSAGTVRQWASEAAQAAGLSKAEYGDMAAVMGAQLKNMGVAQADLAGETNGLITMGADLAAQFGGPTSAAVEALGSLMRGEADPIEKYGVSIKQADIAARMAADGTDKLTGKQAKAAKTAAIMALLTEQTASAHGAFAREADTAAVSQQKMNAEIENAQASIGAALLPVVAQLTTKFAAMAQWAGKHPTLFRAIAAAVLVAAAAILVLNVSVKAYGLAVELAGKQAVKGWLMALGPIALVIAGIAAVAVGFVLLWKHSATFRKVVLAVWAAVRGAFAKMVGFIKRNWKTMLIALTGPIGIAAALIIRNWDKIRTVVRTVTDAIKTLWRNTIDAIKSKLATFKAAAVTQWNAIKTAVGNVVEKVRELAQKITGIRVPGTIQTAFDNVKAAADRVLDVIKSIVEWIKDIPTPHIDWPSPPKWFDKVMPGMVAPPAAAAPAVRAPTARGPSPAAAGGGVTINVTGALDPEAVARQIRRILEGHDRRVSGLRTG